MQHTRIPSSLVLLLSSSLLVACGGSSSPPGDDDVAPGTGGMPSTPGSGGSPATPGTGGSGGMPPASSGGTGGTTTPVMQAPPCAAGDTVPADALLLSDFEDVLGSVNKDNGFSGGWYTYKDETAGGMITPAAGFSPVSADEIPGGGRCAGTGGSTFALHVSGDGFKAWGAGTGTDFKFQPPPADAPANTPGMKVLFDASAYSGIAFWARVGDSSGAVKSVRMNVKDVQTDPAGKMCSDAMSMGPMACHDDFGKQIPLTAQWKKHTVSFAEMKQGTFGKQYQAIKKDSLYAIQFQFGPATKFDLWLDDVHFVK